MRILKITEGNKVIGVASSIKEVADIIGVSRQHVYKQYREDISYVTYKHKVYHLEDVTELITDLIMPTSILVGEESVLF